MSRVTGRDFNEWSVSWSNNTLTKIDDDFAIGLGDGTDGMSPPVSIRLRTLTAFGHISVGGAGAMELQFIVYMNGTDSGDKVLEQTQSMLSVGAWSAGVRGDILVTPDDFIVVRWGTTQNDPPFADSNTSINNSLHLFGILA